MKNFHNGVSYYTSGLVPIHFPENDVVCRHCIMLGNDYGVGRVKCLSTGEIIPAPDYMRGQLCPITFLNDKE